MQQRRKGSEAMLGAGDEVSPCINEWHTDSSIIITPR
jgi:hypothetical protein